MATRRSTPCTRSFRSMHESRKPAAPSRCLRPRFFVEAATLGLWAVSSVVQPKTTRRNSARFQPPTGSRRAGPLPSMRAFIGDSAKAYSLFSRCRCKEHELTSYVSATSGQLIDVRVPIAGKSASFPKAQGRRIKRTPSTRRSSRDDAVLSLSRTSCSVFEYHDRWKSLDAQDFLGKLGHMERPAEGVRRQPGWVNGRTPSII